YCYEASGIIALGHLCTINLHTSLTVEVIAMNLKDKVIVITGGGQGLGRAMAIYLASKGAKPALIDINAEALDATVNLCMNEGVEARSYIANIADENAVIETFDNIIADFGTIDALVNNAGITCDGMFIKAKDGEVSKRMSLES